MTSIASKLDAVTVYREGAVCTRLAAFTPRHGQALRVGGLPLAMDPGSLRARVVSGGARVLDVRPQFDVQLADEVDVPSEQRSLEAAQQAVDQLEARRERLAAELTELESLRPRFLDHRPGDPPREAPVSAMLALTDFTDAELARRLEQRRALDTQLADAQRELELRRHRLHEATSARRTERAQLSRLAVVTLSADAAGELALEYFVPGARWVPNYQLKLERGMATGALLLRASVAQQTGEDWSNVQLALSTASLARRTDVPELKALKLGRRQAAPPRSGWREAPPGLDELFSGFDAMQAPLPPKPAPLPPPPMQPIGFGAKGAAEVDKKRQRGGPALGGGMPGSSGGPPPAPMNAPMAPPMAKAAAMRPQSAPSMDQQSPPSMSRSRAEAPMARRRMAVDDGEDEMPMDDEFAEASLDLDSQDGYGGASSPEESALSAGLSLDVALMDYSRLIMSGVEQPGSDRGRLQPMGVWDSMFLVGVSVQVDLVMAVASAARNRATSVSGLSLPASCTPVTAVDSFDYRYDCRARVDVPSTGKWSNVPVMSCEVGLTPEYVCVPAVEAKVYRTLQVANRSPHALLPGPVDVTAGDEFLMTTRLPAIPPRSDLAHRLGLGVEEAIKVARKTNYKETTGGFLGGSTVLPHELEIELNNRLGTPALVEVRERVPWADPDVEKDVKLEEPQVQPPWEKLEAPIDGGQVVRGARRWRVTVPPGQSLKLLAQFTIRIPSDRMLVGGNRRS